VAVDVEEVGWGSDVIRTEECEVFVCGWYVCDKVGERDMEVSDRFSGADKLEIVGGGELNEAIKQ